MKIETRLLLDRARRGFAMGVGDETDGENHGWIEWAHVDGQSVRVRADDEDGNLTTVTVTLADLRNAEKMHPEPWGTGNTPEVANYPFAAHAFNLAVARERRRIARGGVR